jgi:hypothetical protein
MRDEDARWLKKILTVWYVFCSQWGAPDISSESRHPFYYLTSASGCTKYSDGVQPTAPRVYNSWEHVVYDKPCLPTNSFNLAISIHRCRVDGVVHSRSLFFLDLFGPPHPHQQSQHLFKFQNIESNAQQLFIYWMSTLVTAIPPQQLSHDDSKHMVTLTACASPLTSCCYKNIMFRLNRKAVHDVPASGD